MNRMQIGLRTQRTFACSNRFKRTKYFIGSLTLLTLFPLATITTAYAQDADLGNTQRAEPFEGTWGVRILLPTSHDQAALDSFDVPAFIDQVTQLKSISYVMINVHNGHFGSYHNAPHPELQAVFGKKHFPDRDLFGEVLDALAEHDLKALVYFSAPGWDWTAKYVPNKAIKPLWQETIQSKSMSDWDAVANLIVQHYSERYGKKISGWWFDRVTKRRSDAELRTMAKAARSGNPDAVLTFHVATGPINRGTPYCDYTAGHPHPMAHSKGPWDNVNLRMVTAIEEGPFIKGPYANNTDRSPEAPDEGTLGHIFMPFQRNWKNGDAKFPPDQSLDWTRRVVNAGGFYTWAVAREGGLFAEPQFSQLLEIDAAMERAKHSE